MRVNTAIADVAETALKSLGKASIAKAVHTEILAWTAI
jgi:hypothetical protein